MILARLLAPTAFGLVALASVATAFIEVFLDQGMSDAIIQRSELEAAHLDTAFWTNLAFAIVFTVAFYFGANVVSRLLGNVALAPLLRWLSLDFVVAALGSVQQAILRRTFRFASLAVRTFLGVAVGGAVAIAMAVTGFGVWSLVGMELVRTLVATIALWTASNWRPKFRFSLVHFKELFHFGVNITGTNALNFVSTRADDLLIGRFLGSTALGYYTVAYQLSGQIARLLSGITSQVALPAFSSAQGDPIRMRRGFYAATYLTSVVAFPLFAAVIVLAADIVRGVLGAKWGPSVPLMRILPLIGLLQVLYTFNTVVIVAMGKPSWRLMLTTVNAVTNVIGFVIAVRWGIFAVGAAYVIRGYLVSPLSLIAVHRVIGIDFGKYFSRYLRPLICTILMVGAMLTARVFGVGNIEPALLRIALLSVIGWVVYFSALFGRLALKHRSDLVRHVYQNVIGFSTSK